MENKIKMDIKNYIDMSLVFSKFSLIIGGIFILLYSVSNGILSDVIHNISLIELVIYGVSLMVAIFFTNIIGSLLSYWIYFLIKWFSVTRGRFAKPEKRLDYITTNTDSIFASTKGTKIFYGIISVILFFSGAVFGIIYYKKTGNSDFLKYFSYMVASGFSLYAFINIRYDKNNEIKSLMRNRYFFIIIPLVPFILVPISKFIGPIYLKTIGIIPDEKTILIMNEEASDIIRDISRINNNRKDKIPLMECVVSNDNKKERVYPQAKPILYGIGDYIFFSVPVAEKENPIVVKIPTKDLIVLKNVKIVSCF
jgi:hypothetical protein